MIEIFDLLLLRTPNKSGPRETWSFLASPVNHHQLSAPFKIDKNWSTLTWVSRERRWYNLPTSITVNTLSINKQISQCWNPLTRSMRQNAVDFLNSKHSPTANPQKMRLTEATLCMSRPLTPPCIPRILQSQYWITLEPIGSSYVESDQTTQNPPIIRHVV